MKKVICLLLAALMIMACFVGCGGGNDGGLTEEEKEILEQRRTIVERNARWQASFRWTPAETVQYRIGTSSGLAVDLETNAADVVTLKKGTIYEGIPYTAGVGSGYSFTKTAVGTTDDGVMVLNLTTDQLGGGNRQDKFNVARLGNNCADYIFWAWSMVDTTISYTDTVNMVPINGIVLVGDYDLQASMLANTPFVVQSNGQQRMFRAYAQLQKADGVVHINKHGAGHAMMIVHNSVHYRDDGSIDGAKSYVTVLEQNSGCERYQQSTYIDPATGQTIVRMQDLDVVFTYDKLAQSGYLPITCKALIDPSPLEEEKIVDTIPAEEHSIENIFNGVFTCPYRISHVTVAISDKDGNVVQESTMFCLGGEMRNFLLDRFTHPQEQVVLLGKINLDALASGEYTVTHTATTATGNQIVARNFTFSK
jgi:hypothetical protein